MAAKTLLIVGFPASFILSDLSDQEEESKHSLSAVYTTEHFIKNNDTLASLTKENTRWNQFILEDNYAKVTFDNEAHSYYESIVDTAAKVIHLTPYSDTTLSYVLHYQFGDDNYFTLSGLFGSDSISATFKVKRKDDYPLVNRGFNWINEFPYNR